jgi:uncharacterized membrane protein
MNRRLLAASALSTAVGLALALQMQPGAAGQQKTQPMALHLEKCYGINAVGKNDCAAGAHSCAGQATMARDPRSYVELPAGDCSKIAGGSLRPA